MNRRTVLWLTLIGVAAVVVGAALARLLTPVSVPLSSGTWLPQPAPLAVFHLTDLSGQQFDLNSLRGHPTLMFFGFTHCPDVCPVTLATLAQVQRSAPLPGSRTVFVTLDPQRDSADVLRVYLGEFSPRFIGVRAPPAALAPLLATLHVAATREPVPGGGYTFIHSATVYLIDTHARLAAVFSPPLTEAGLTADLRRIAAADRL
ncbi:MAG TPA: SCO family protein [Steroidobacteraceae bacterium]|jgi:protein SCO1/2|nr:SCO family protein [Steroidobacteraceae bacterium]